MQTAPAPARSVTPWTLWCSAASVATSTVGVYWDIAWHESVGRDSFWSPPHMAIYAGAVLAGVACGALVLSATLGLNAEARRQGVRILGLYGPLGAFVAGWGGVAMLTSAPFDNWWHNAYGLDVKILSPPHMVLAAGILAMQFGVLLLLASALNRSAASRLLRGLFLGVGGLGVAGLLVVLLEETARGLMHSARFYRLVAMVAPLLLMALGVASRFKWGATLAAGIYTALRILMVWFFPLVPAEPKLGPVLIQVHSLIPAEFPILIIIPALALDWLRSREWKPWRTALVGGPLFIAALVAVQWPFATFLQSAWARNWFFGAHLFGYEIDPHSKYALHEFWSHEATTGEFALVMLIAVLTAQAGSWLGLRLGGWMRGVVR